jgi:hypothetical protein
MKLGRVSSAGLFLSGVAGIVTPKSVGENLRITPVDERGVTEIRAGLGGTYAALGGWALLRAKPGAETAVGVTWLGAAAVRLASLALDRPRTDRTFWAYLGLELGLGVTALLSAKARESD